ncbi:penicillin-binding protein [Bacillus subtilis]|uniref:peptidoglycan D,D-transpeptidase FtsI family protein n=1 Tax=Bacillus TaxID=1386 RepID=UPI00052A82BA|nr:penicillin-binding protein 2 [Bacillus amyloliquefaciens]AIW34550.1 penicillin-binding protein [Bacillus subtilis]MCM3248774.1 penicillin-binding protein 2 [Bacillus amyloliquefaciens]MCY7423658.1 penicillin-binding protein 2 [Bacillus amyloliquefaciens]MEC0966265.1 penicillin-binding protein 2 [Bacillus amyloliquefaciens]MEC1012834.1 penicillin-binding protein 2 [Bacillus amyloliquefaciens]
MIVSKRLKAAVICFLLVFFFLLARLAEIQLFFTESFSKSNINLIQESVKQRTEEVLISDGRGSFLDRNGEELTGKKQPAVVLFPFLVTQDWPVDRVSAILGMKQEELRQLLTEAKKPVILNSKKIKHLTKQSVSNINSLKYPGIYGVYMKDSKETNIAAHLLGATNQDPELLKKKYPGRKELPITAKIGTSGMERTFDEFLLADQDTKLLYHVDGRGNPLFGMDVKYTAEANAFYPLQVKTSIDRNIQKAMEDVLKDRGLKKGGAVLLDIEKSSVLGMVSKPDADMSKQQTLQNYMLTPIYPGSVFKTVIAAAAIEQNEVKPSTSFNCSLNLYGEPGDDKGTLSFGESFAQSCNYTFTSLAEKLVKKDDSVIENMAEKLGLTQRAGWEGKLYREDGFRQLYNEKSGVIWGDAKDKTVKRAVAQTAIGQKNVKVTPLEVANMMATIARGGEKKQVKIADKIEYKNGTTMASFKDQPLKGKSIDKYTAQQLQKILREVVTSPKGTGRRFQDLPYAVAGKSGTAQTGMFTQEKQTLYHKWFAGYFPADKPKYALVVLHMDTPGDKALTNTVFYDIVKKVHENETN